MKFQIGDTFYFAGNWNTEPGAWEIADYDEETHMVSCVPIDGPALIHAGEANQFFDSFVERKVYESLHDKASA